MMEYEIRRSESRGRLFAGWLQARFSFNFGSYHAPDRNRFSALRVLNEDWVQPGTGFAMHPHEDVEILMIPLEGAIEHADSLGNSTCIVPGEILYMGAGSGIQHSQMNPLRNEVDRHLQIWILPRRSGTSPQVLKRRFDPAGRVGRWQLIASAEGMEESLPIDQDVAIWRAQLRADGQALPVPVTAGRHLYLHVIDGSANLRAGPSSQPLHLDGGDALVWRSAEHLELMARQQSPADVLLLDLPGDDR